MQPSPEKKAANGGFLPIARKADMMIVPNRRL
jgi:hypothetical protein